ncbi:MAG TPA: DUF308 domain-containing protein [Woeseiaceae bacterium]|nr:DUF308 domain-containing protein [Woeseiaceae bacterium]
MMPIDVSSADRSLTDRSIRWQTVWGVLLVLAGIGAVLMPMIAAIAKVIVLAWLLLLGGAFETVHAVQTRYARGFGWRLLSGILTLVLGLLLLLWPSAGVAALALLVGAFFLLGGIARALLAWQFRPLPGWGWIMFDALLSIALAVLIAVAWPERSYAVIGILVGLWLIVAGIWRIALARVAKAVWHSPLA